MTTTTKIIFGALVLASGMASGIGAGVGMPVPMLIQSAFAHAGEDHVMGSDKPFFPLNAPTKEEKEAQAHSQHAHQHEENGAENANLSPAEKATAAEAAGGEVILLKVNGLVCDFCAQAIDKVFRQQAAVANVDVDLSSKYIRVWLKAGETLADEVLKKMVLDAGYNLVAIERSNANASKTE